MNTVASQDSGSLIADARELGHLADVQIGPWEYRRFTRRFHAIPEGTAVFGDTFIWGYPRIARILRLANGIPAQFEQPFWVEEKIDGYNVRIFRHGDVVLALTRRGFVCPFTTDRLPDLLPVRIFDEHPEWVLCAEVAGPENPYNEGSPPFIAEDVKLFVFDIMQRGQPGFLPWRDKQGWLQHYGLPAAPQYGRFAIDEAPALAQLIRKLDGERREGIVCKEDSARDHRIKYVTGGSNINDIEASAASIRQLPPEFFMQRILRLGLFLEEHGLEPTATMKEALGDALLAGTLNAIRQYRECHKVTRRYRCRFRERAHAEWLIEFLERALGKGQVLVRRLEWEGTHYRLEFDKVLPKPTGLFSHVLGGGPVFD